jgi:hypothetical protein
MNIAKKIPDLQWLLLVFSLPAKNASQRVEVWRKLKRYGVIGLKSSGYVLPRNAANEERLQWLAAEIRKQKGEASVLQVGAIDNLPSPELVRMFNEARNREYEAIAKELRRVAGAKARPAGAIGRLRRRYEEVRDRDRDFFQAPSARRVEQQLAALEAPAEAAHHGGRSRKDYVGRTWVTRPRPGIDRVSSAWLIRRFIDPGATFAFAKDAEQFPRAIPFARALPARPPRARGAPSRAEAALGSSARRTSRSRSRRRRRSTSSSRAAWCERRLTRRRASEARYPHALAAPPSRPRCRVFAE